jgi:hypothetical protein
VVSCFLKRLSASILMRIPSIMGKIPKSVQGKAIILRIGNEK